MKNHHGRWLREHLAVHHGDYVHCAWAALVSLDLVRLQPSHPRAVVLFRPHDSPDCSDVKGNLPKIEQDIAFQCGPKAELIKSAVENGET